MKTNHVPRSLLIAVASVTSVSFFADRVRQGLNREAHQLLGGDLLMVGDRPGQVSEFHWITATCGRALVRRSRSMDRREFYLKMHPTGRVYGFNEDLSGRTMCTPTTWSDGVVHSNGVAMWDHS